ncbi:MAG: tyrosine-type recombinase/integrase [Planctomycetota bacterium]|jgi:integrase
MKRVGRKPYGYYPDERDVIRKIRFARRKRRDGTVAGPWQIASEFKKKGILGRGGKPLSGQLIRRIIENPIDFEEVKLEDQLKPKPKKRSKRNTLLSTQFLTVEEVKACKRVCDGDLLVIFEVLLGSGLRAGELCALEIRDLRLRYKQYTIEVERGKGSKPRSVQISSRLRAILQRYLQTRNGAKPTDAVFLNRWGKPLRYKALLKRIRQIGIDAGIRKREDRKQLHCHILRHTFGTFLYLDTKDIRWVRDQMGHGSIATTEIYVSVVESLERGGMERFDKRFRGK